MLDHHDTRKGPVNLLVDDLHNALRKKGERYHEIAKCLKSILEEQGCSQRSLALDFTLTSQALD